MATTTNYAFKKPNVGSTGWGDDINGNFDSIDEELKSLRDDLDAVGPGGDGADGAPGVTGGVAWQYDYSDTHSATPATGTVRVDNATDTSVTNIYASETDKNSLAVATLLALLRPGDIVRIGVEGDPTKYKIFAVSGVVVDNGSDRTIPVSYVTANGTIANGDDVSLSVSFNHGPGATGVFAFSTTTSSGPSTGTIRQNNSTDSSVTNLYVHETDALATDVSGLLGQLSVNDKITIQSNVDPKKWKMFQVTGAATDNGSDRTVPVVYVGGSGTISNGESVSTVINLVGRRIRALSTLTVSSNTYTPNCDTTDEALIVTPAANFTVAAPTGTPRDGQLLMIRIRSDATGRVPTWNAIYQSSGVAALPTAALPNSKTVTFGFKYDANATKWTLFAADSLGY